MKLSTIGPGLFVLVERLTIYRYCEKSRKVMRLKNKVNSLKVFGPSRVHTKAYYALLLSLSKTDGNIPESQLMVTNLCRDPVRIRV